MASQYVDKYVTCYGCDKQGWGRFPENQNKYWCDECYPRYRAYLSNTRIGRIDFHEAFTATGMDRRLAGGFKMMKGD